MKKVLIITLSGNNNFGNKLQNYALSKILEKENLVCKTLWVNSIYDGNIVTSFLRFLKRLFIKNRNEESNRKIEFVEFDKLINYHSKKFNFWNSLNKISEEYDYLVVGSDQVWNVNSTHNYNLYFLEKIPDSKKIAYSASFGDIDFNGIDKKRISKDLKSFKSISVREDNAYNFVKNNTSRDDVKVLLDPTMLLNSEEWQKISKKPKYSLPKKYILLYFLGEIDQSTNIILEQAAKENDCVIINVLDRKSQYYNIGPAEFLYLEKNAFLICTDSFHSCVFSFIFDVPFVVFERKYNSGNSLNSRIDTLISKFQLKDRKFDGHSITKKNISHDYTRSYELLNKEIKDVNNFITESFDLSKKRGDSI